MLGLSLLGSGSAVARAHDVSGATPAYTSVVAPGTGSGIDAGVPFPLAALPTQAQAEDPACALEPPDAAENANDTDSLQCGDQNGNDDAAQ